MFVDYIELLICDFLEGMLVLIFVKLCIVFHIIRLVYN